MTMPTKPLFARPRDARGLLPLILGALAAGKAIYGAVEANQQKQRTKGYLGDAYRSGVERLNTRQNDIRNETAESLNQRGLLGGGYSPIHRAMGSEIGSSGVRSMTPIDASAQANDLAGSVQLRNEREFDIDRHDLDAAYQKDLHENQANALNAQIGAIAGGVSGVASAYGTGQDLSTISALGRSGSTTHTPIASALLSGSAFDGIHPTDPLGDASSSWHIPAGLTIPGDGRTNATFNTSGVS